MSGQEGAESLENNAKNQEYAEHLVRGRADREAPSDQDGPKRPDSYRWPGY